jgi:hypothetical protein
MPTRRLVSCRRGAIGVQPRSRRHLRDGSRHSHARLGRQARRVRPPHDERWSLGVADGDRTRALGARQPGAQFQAGRGSAAARRARQRPTSRDRRRFESSCADVPRHRRHRRGRGGAPQDLVLHRCPREIHVAVVRRARRRQRVRSDHVRAPRRYLARNDRHRGHGLGTIRVEDAGVSRSAARPRPSRASP